MSLYEDRLANGKFLESVFVRLGDANATDEIGNLASCVKSGGGTTGHEVFANRGDLSFLLRVPEEPVVLLRTSFVGISDMVSWGIACFLACATARGPANRGRIGAAMLPTIKLARTVTGRTFSFSRSFFFVASPLPNTMFCIRL